MRNGKGSRRSLLGLVALLLGLGWSGLSGLTGYTQTWDPRSASWDAIVERSRGTTVNWAMWSGSDQINRFVDGWVATQLKQNYQITLNRIPLSDTVEAVNKVVGEVQAGLTTGGSIDLIWINGENFRTLKQGNLLFGPFTDPLPSMAYYQNNLSVESDFGLPIDGYEAPYTGSYYLMAYDSARVSQPPQSFAELLTWAEANPGRFTYVAPPAFDGSRFVLTALYGTTGGYEQYAGAEFNADLWVEKSPQVLAYLRQLEPYLWQKGVSYPPSQSRLAELFANGEIWIMPTFVSNIALGIIAKQFPTTTRAFTMAGSTLNDPSFTAIPSNASNPAGAMVLANLLASPAGQLEKLKPEVWGDPPLIRVADLSAEEQAAFAEVEVRYGVPLQPLIQEAVPVVNAEYTTRLEQEWQKQIAPN
ncbi:MAG: ABC transporter substrate-binding protein [Cyanobacteriota bacterium]|nr:ABC transporter substrate-binding protein [Cyanobacteriota bacterium]